MISQFARIRINRDQINPEEIIIGRFRAPVQDRLLLEDSVGGDYPNVMLFEDNRPILLEQ